ncbi:KIAA1143 family protein [Megaselia abdita]
MNKKHQIAYTKPTEPAFLTEFKKRAGFIEADTVETKRQKIENFSDSDSDQEDYKRQDEKPEVVVLNPGDLTAEEASREEARIKREENEKKADLNQKVVFKSKSKNQSGSSTSTDDKVKGDKKKSKKQKETKSKLSFDEEAEDELADGDD